jgi:hypothetical protein
VDKSGLAELVFHLAALRAVRAPPTQSPGAASLAAVTADAESGVHQVHGCIGSDLLRASPVPVNQV